MYYLKLWHEARNDAKLRALTDPQFRVWFNLLLFASEQAIRGNIEFESEELLAVEVAGGNVDLLNETVKRLETLRCVSSRFIGQSGTSGLRRIAFLSFEKRQECNGQVSTPRVQKHRAIKKLREHETDETQMKRGKRVPGTNETTELELDSELEKESPLHSPPRGEVRVRSGDDLSEVNQAISLLGSDLRTEHIATQLGRMHNTARLVELAGWKWLRAAKWILEASIDESKRRNFAYFASIAKNLTDSDREEKPPAKRESPAHRKQRELREALTARFGSKEVTSGEG